MLANKSRRARIGALLSAGVAALSLELQAGRLCCMTGCGYGSPGSRG